MLALIAGFSFCNVGPDYRHADIVDFLGKSVLRIEGRASTYAFSAQHRASLDALPDGRFALAWESRRQRKGLSGTYARVFDAEGKALTQELPTTKDAEFPQLTPSIAVASDGNPQVAYLSRFRDGRHTPAYLGDVRLESGKGLQSDPLLARGPSSQIVAAWTGEVAHLQTRLFVQVFNSLNKAEGAPLRVSGFEQVESVPSLATNDRGFALVWQHYDAKGKPAGLQARLFDWNARPVTPVRDIVGPRAIEPSLDARGDGFIVGWAQAKNDGSFEICAQRLDSRLSAVASVLNVPSQNGDQNAVAVAGRKDGSFAIAWNNRTESDTDIYAQLFDKSARPVASHPFRVTRLSKGQQGMAEATGVRRMVYTPKLLAVAWSGDAGEGDTVSANFTLLRFDGNASLVKEINANATKVDDVAAHGAPKLKYDRMVTVQAGPHEPPISDFKKVVNPWDQVIAMSADGGFNAYSQTSFTPPDCQMAVGPEHIVVVVNDGIAFYTKDGTQTYMNNMRQTNGFWGNLASTDNFIYDPEAFFDTQTGRYFVLACQGAGGTSDSAALVGVSDDNDPNGTWYLYRFVTTGLAGNFFDSQNLGTDANVVYVTGDGFGLGANYPVYCIEKAPLLAGLPPGTIRSTTLPTSTQSAGIPPVQDSGSVYYLVEHKEAGTNTGIDIIALSNPLTAPSFQRFTLTVPAYSPPGSPPQQGTTSRVNVYDSRFWSLKYKNGYLWATHHINSRTLARWYQIDPRGWPNSGNNPVLVQSGNIDLGATIYTFFCSIGADDGNNAGIVYARGATTEFYSANHSSRRMNDALGTMGGHTIDKVATGPYTAGRWGDYSECDPDPEYPGVMWGFSEWAEGTSWRAWVQPFNVTNELWPIGENTFRGTRTGGTTKDLIYDDDQFMTFRNGVRLNQADPYIGVELRSRTRHPQPNTVQFQLVYRIDAFGFNIRTALLNHTTGLFETVDLRTASTTEQTISVNVANPINYIRQSDGLIFSHITIEAPGPVTSNTVNLTLDRWAWIEN